MLYHTVLCLWFVWVPESALLSGNIIHSRNAPKLVPGWQFRYSVTDHWECVRWVRSRSLSGMAMLVSLCHRGSVMYDGGVRTLWATPGVFSRDHNSSPRVTMETRSSSSAHQATDPPLVTVLSLDRNRDTLKQHIITITQRFLHINHQVQLMVTWVWGHVIGTPAWP